MARLFPSRLPQATRDDPDCRAECKVYDALDGQLDDDYRVFHSVKWLSEKKGHPPRDCEADFVIAHEKHGILVLEVKGGQIAYEAQRGRWTSNATQVIDDPVEQAKRNKYSLREKLASLRGYQGKVPGFGHAVAFPDCSVLHDLGMAVPREIVVSAEDLDWLDKKVAGIFEFWAGQPKEWVWCDAVVLGHLESLLARDFELHTSLGVLLRDEDEQILELTEAQLKVLDLFSCQPRAAVSGGAGTGKSVLALEKARRLAGEGYRTLLTCFNRPLAEHMQRAAGEIEGLTINTFHGVCEDLAREAGVDLPEYPEGEAPPPEYFDKVLPGAFLDAVDRRRDLRFEAIVVDEGQDLGADLWDLLELGERGESILYVFYDDNQNIYGEDLALPDGLTRVTLSENLRNTQAIHDAAMPFYEGGLHAEGPEGRPVEWVEIPGRGYENELSKVLHRLIREESVPPERIAVLSGHSMKRSEFGEADRIKAFECTHDTSGVPGKVAVESIYRFKGLQRRVVVLVEMERIIESERLTDRKREELFYVGFTRAKGHLVVMGNRAVLKRLRQSTA